MKGAAQGGQSVTIGKSQEDYLEAILILKDRVGFVRSVDLARQLHITPASVCTMLRALTKGGYVERKSAAPYTLTLTEKGKQVAEQTYARHCFFRRLLVDAGVDTDTAEREACELEHAISPESFSLLCSRLEACAE